MFGWSVSVFVSFTDRMHVVFGIIIPHRHNSIGKQGRDSEFISFVLIYSWTQLGWLVISDCLNLLVICMWFLESLYHIDTIV